jgi:hypothetical protein
VFLRAYSEAYPAREYYLDEHDAWLASNCGVGFGPAALQQWEAWAKWVAFYKVSGDGSVSIDQE